jgi:two-component system, NarL family, invasion response regulator UvrY
MIRVLLADDHAIVRDGVKRLLHGTSDIRVTAEASSGDEVMDLVAAGGIDLVVLDVSMPGKGFLEILRDLRERHPRIRAIVLSAHAEEEYAERALKAGATGYVMKERTPDELLEAIRRASRGLRYVSESLAQHLVASLSGDRERPAHGQLSDREFEVLQLLGRGRSVKEIAARLALSPKTVSTYRERILQKLDLKTTADLIRYAIQQGIAD